MEFVYELVDPLIDLPFYVGITNNPKLRLYQHLECKENDAKSEVIRDLQACGAVPRMLIREILETRQEAKEREVYWIWHYMDKGIALTNIRHTENKRKERKLPKPKPKTPQKKTVVTDDFLKAIYKRDMLPEERERAEATLMAVLDAFDTIASFGPDVRRVETVDASFFDI